MIVGLIGLWGFILTSGFFIPVASAIKNFDEGTGIHEDTVDSFLMVKDNPTILIFCFTFIVFIGSYNVAAVFVIQLSNAVIRSILENFRTLCIWFFQLIIHYSLQGTAFGNQHASIGEEWSIWSYMQLSGFILLFSGTMVYNQVLQLPFFKYSDDKTLSISTSIQDFTCPSE